MEFKDFNEIENATRRGRREFARFGIGLLWPFGLGQMF